MKRLRLRGDWSDTGPRARPESERERDGKMRTYMHALSVSQILNTAARMVHIHHVRSVYKRLRLQTHLLGDFRSMHQE